ncbi:hypothetical protein M422DRAFT_215184, partial [Sphaerobolus stellatus SS14]
MDYEGFLGVEDMGEYDGGDIREEDNGNEEECEPDSDVKDTDGNKTVERDGIDHNVTLRELALTAMYEQEVPPISKPSCFGIDCSVVGVYDCVDCDAMGYYCQECIIERHQRLPFHRMEEWDGNCLCRTSLAELVLIIFFGHGHQPCPNIHDELGIQDITILDITGVHTVRMGWCRCATACSQAEQLFARKWFPATILRPRTAFTFRVLKLFH